MPVARPTAKRTFANNGKLLSRLRNVMRAQGWMQMSILMSRFAREKINSALRRRAEITVLRELRWVSPRIKVYYATRDPASPRTREEVP